MPISSRTRSARGVSPSPQVLSRGKSALSSSRTSSPWRLRKCAAAEPPGPAPTTTTSCSCTTPEANAQPDVPDRAGEEPQQQRGNDDEEAGGVEHDQSREVDDDEQRRRDVAKVGETAWKRRAAEHQPGDDPQAE